MSESSKSNLDIEALFSKNENYKNIKDFSLGQIICDSDNYKRFIEYFRRFINEINNINNKYVSDVNLTKFNILKDFYDSLIKESELYNCSNKMDKIDEIEEISKDIEKKNVELHNLPIFRNFGGNKVRTRKNKRKNKRKGKNQIKRRY